MYLVMQLTRRWRGRRLVTTVSLLPSTLEGVPYDLFVLKDSGYTMKIMLTYGSLLMKETECTSGAH
jgi:hypothetical protein